MTYRAVIFDLFETLITEWGHPKYVKSEMCADLGVDRETFDLHWESKEEARYLGEMSFADAVRHVCGQCGLEADDALIAAMLDKRIRMKSACFEHVNPEVFRLLDAMKAMGLKLAIVSNCSAEEVVGFEQSRIRTYFDQVVLSCDVGLRKPDVRIYRHASELLGVAADECLFVGDGGSHELEGARNAGMTAVQAKWYTNQHPRKRESMAGFLAAEEPMELLTWISQ